MPFGLWTACTHPNEMTDRGIDELERFIQINAKHFVDINKLKYKKWTILNSLFSSFYWMFWKSTFDFRMVMRK